MYSDEYHWGVLKSQDLLFWLLMIWLIAGTIIVRQQVLLKFMQAVLTLFCRTSDGQKSAIKLSGCWIHLPEDLIRLSRGRLRSSLAEGYCSRSRKSSSFPLYWKSIKMLTIRASLFRRIYKSEMVGKSKKKKRKKTGSAKNARLILVCPETITKNGVVK